jgi:hypothetical protein
LTFFPERVVRAGLASLLLNVAAAPRRFTSSLFHINRKFINGTVFLALLALVSSALAQYSARTDVVVTQPDAKPLPTWSGPSGASTNRYDALYQNVRMTRCTDANTNPGNLDASYFAGEGGSAQKNIWDVDDTLFMFSDLNGDDFLMRFNGAAGSCSPVQASGGGLFAISSGVFSKADPVGGPYTFYDFQWPNPLQVSVISISASGNPTVEAVVADFAPALYQLGLSAWPGERKSVALGTVTKPTVNNSGGYAFQAIVGGKTGSSQPNWNATQIPYGATGLNPIRDGTVTWENVDVITNASPYVDPGGVEVSDRYIAESVGFNPNGQDYGVWAVIYDKTANEFYQLNTWTGIETDYTCSGGSGYNCSGGTWSSTVIGRNPNDRFTWHENGLLFSGNAFVLTPGYCQSCVATAPEVWAAGSATVIAQYPNSGGHFAAGYQHLANQAENNDYYSERAVSAPATQVSIWAPNPCSGTGSAGPPYSPPPPWPYPACFPLLDSHFGWQFNKGQDQEPIIGTGTVGETGYDYYPSASPWQYEVLGVSTCGPASGQASCADGYSTDTVWRFGRTLTFGTEPNFYAAISSSSVSQTGKYIAVTSDGLGSMGSTSGANSCNEGFSWAAGHSYAANTLITPVVNNNLLYTFQNSAACISGSGDDPSWSQDGTTNVTDSTCTWVPQSIANCRSDVVVYTLGQREPQ